MRRSFLRATDKKTGEDGEGATFLYPRLLNSIEMVDTQRPDRLGVLYMVDMVGKSTVPYKSDDYIYNIY